MAKDIWVISDTHFNHANILKFTGYDGKKVRHFTDLQEMNEEMISRWNSVVRPGDKVYHLGDVFFGPYEDADRILSRLNGQKRLIVGNHDTIYGRPGEILQRHFRKIHLWRNFSELGLLLSHVPVHESTLGESRFTGKQMVNVHGHTHQNGSPNGPYKSVCVEMINYTPVHIETLRN